MDVIYLFRRLVFVQVLLGIVAFCMAEQNPEMLLVAGALTALSWYVVEGPAGRPLPQWQILLGALAAVGWLVVELLYFKSTNVITAVGHFTMWLQVLQLYGYKRNHDYALILVLSLLQMVGASVLSVSLIFGLLLALYCVLALFTVLMFQIKSASDQVLKALTDGAPRNVRVERPKVIAGRGHRWQFRATAAGIGLGCGGIAALVFILLPRASRFDLGESPPTPTPQPQVGYNPEVNLSGPPPVEVSREPLLTLQVLLHGEPLKSGTMNWRLRGTALDDYNHRTHTWTRSDNIARLDLPVTIPARGFALTDTASTPSEIVARITLRNSAQHVLFTLYAPTFINSSSLSMAYFNPEDQQINTPLNSSGALVYEVHSSLQQHPGMYAKLRQAGRAEPPRVDPWVHRPTFDPDTYARSWTTYLAPLRALAQRIIQREGLHRDPRASDDPQDAQIAAALTRYLQTNFTYSLANPQTSTPDEEPIAEFLFNRRRGHCELFASALAALARSLGLRARVVTGFVVQDYNPVGGYYVIRPTDAHAWTEIECGPANWRTFDPTPAQSLALEHHAQRSVLTYFRDVYEYLEFAWISGVVAYDKETRHAVLVGLQTSFQNAAADQHSWLGQITRLLRQTLENWRFDTFSYSVMGVMLVAIGVGLLTLVRIWVHRRRRLLALQLMHLSPALRRSLSRRLSFYLTMLDMLERHGFHRPAWQSPFAFAQNLADRDSLRFEPVLMLTEHFYEIRFGHRPMDPQRHKLIRIHLHRLEEMLGGRS